MPSQARKYRGYRTQKVVADYLSQWWEHAEPVGAGRQGSDIVGVPFDCEVKARADFKPLEWLRQVRSRQSAGCAVSFVVLRLNGQGESAEQYAAMLTLADLTQLLLKAGYGEMTDRQIPVRCRCGNWIIEKTTCSICVKLAVGQ